jgi:FixJ family two-component response regulator
VVIPQTGPLIVCTSVPDAHDTVAGAALADFAEGPAEATALMQTVRTATANTEPITRDRDRSNLIMHTFSSFDRTAL